MIIRSCPSETELDLLSSDSSDHPHHQRLRQHVRSCPDCQTALARRLRLRTMGRTSASGDSTTAGTIVSGSGSASGALAGFAEMETVSASAASAAAPSGKATTPPIFTAPSAPTLSPAAPVTGTGAQAGLVTTVTWHRDGSVWSWRDVMRAVKNPTPPSGVPDQGIGGLHPSSAQTSFHPGVLLRTGAEREGGSGKEITDHRTLASPFHSPASPASTHHGRGLSGEVFPKVAETLRGAGESGDPVTESSELTRAADKFPPSPPVASDAKEDLPWGARSRSITSMDTDFLKSKLVKLSSSPSSSSSPSWGKGESGSPASGRRLPVITGYEVLSELGRGGMGVVYKARHLRLNRLVALKMVHNAVTADAIALARFLHEAEAIAQLHHPNIVQVYDIGEHDGLPFFSMEYVVGRTLADRFDGRPLSPRGAARMAATLARAVEVAHRAGIAHRDLKPANILLVGEEDASLEECVPKISDFGIAKRFDQPNGGPLVPNAALALASATVSAQAVRDQNQTQTGTILGSPCYMAPEQALGRSKEIGPSADIYSLGVILYELLTGRPPFLGNSPMDTIHQVINQEPPPPGKLRRGCPRALETIALKCLNKRPQERYLSSEELADDLDRFLHGSAINARRVSLQKRAWRWSQRHPAAATVLAGSLAVLLGVAGYAAWRESHLRAERRATAEIAARKAFQEQRDRETAVRREEERVRDLTVRVQRLVAKGQGALETQRWAEAGPAFTEALTLLGPERHADLAALRDQADEGVKRNQRELDRAAARDQARAAWASFQAPRDQALFHQSQNNGLSPETNIQSVRDYARKALGAFRLLEGPPVALMLSDDHFSPEERKLIRERVHELTVFYAEAVAQLLPGEDAKTQAVSALNALDRADLVQPPTRTLLLRREAWLRIAGEPALAEQVHARALSAPAKPTAADAFLLGERSYRAGDFAQAIEHLEQARWLQPDHFWAQYLLAICRLRSQDPAQALAALLACQNQRADFPWIYLFKIYAEGELQEYAQADADFAYVKTLVLNDQARYVMLNNHAVTLVRRAQYPLAVQELEDAIRLDPKPYQAYVHLAQARLALGQPDQAVTALNAALERHPKQAALYRERSRAFRAVNNDAAALADLNQAIALVTDAQTSNPAGSHASGNSGVVPIEDYLEKGRLLFKAQNFAETAVCCETILAASPKEFKAHRLRAAALLELRNYEQAIVSFDACLEFGPNSGVLLEARGLAKSLNGQYADALADYARAIRSGRDTSALHNHQGWAYLMLNAPNEAKTEFDVALRLDPKNSDAYSGRALAYVPGAAYLEAVKDARRAVELSPNDPRIALNAARVHAQIVIALQGRTRRDAAGLQMLQVLRPQIAGFLGKALERTPVAEQPRFYQEMILKEPVFQPFRRDPNMLKLPEQFPGLSRTDAHAQATKNNTPR